MSSIDEKKDISKSKQKRIEREERRKKSKRDDLVGTVIGIAAIALILGAIIASIVSSARKNAQVITPSDDFSRYLTEEGFVKGVTASNITTLCSYNNIEIPRSEVEMSDEDFESETSSLLESHQTLNDAEGTVVNDGDKINLDYVGSVDGVEFEGGSTNGSGSDLVIGSGSFIPGFEDQLIGHSVSENFDINVTFPDDYSEELAGKDAVFNITINGVYETGTFDDAFVAEHLSEEANGAKTVAEYRKFLDDEAYEEKATGYIQDYLYDNSTLNKFPKKYLHQLKCNQKFNEQQTYEYMNQMLAMYGQQGYSSFEEYTGMAEDAYDVSLDVACKQAEKEILIIQAIAEKENIRVTDDEIKTCIETLFGEGSYESQLEIYKKPYLAQVALNDKVIKTLLAKATVK